MKRWMKWAAVVLVVAVAGGFTARTLKARKQEQAAASAPASAPLALEFGPADTVKASNCNPRKLKRAVPFWLCVTINKAS